MRPKRQYQCNSCGHKHERPVDRKCPFVNVTQQDESDSDSYIEPAQDVPVDGEDHAVASQDIGEKILAKLVSMETQLGDLRGQVRDNTQRLNGRDTEQQPQGARQRAEAVLPNFQTLQAPQVQLQVDERMRELGQLPENQGRYHSQGGVVSPSGSRGRLYGLRIILWV